ncbi:MAG: hypothetical protein JWQ40_484 [Segetibacter sp.]|nr:hypothetical protein [Segetibacter sp.]
MVYFLAACQQQQKEVQAKIFERRALDDSSLVIKYTYTVENKTWIDSATIKNIVISKDSINLIPNPSKPNAWMPDFKVIP